MDKDLMVISEKIGEIHAKTKMILEQAKKTNGYVAELFTRIRRVELIQASCPVDDLQKTMVVWEKETEVPRFYAKYPKLLKRTIIGFIFAFILQILITGFTFSKYAKEFRATKPNQGVNAETQ